MLITKKFNYCVRNSYSQEEGRYIYRCYGERLAVLELDECGSMLSLSIYDPHSKYGFDTQSVCNATIESWNENVLIYKGSISRIGVKVQIELDPKNGDIVKLTEHHSNGGYLLLTNDENTSQNEIVELQNKQVEQYDSSK